MEPREQLPKKLSGTSAGVMHATPGRTRLRVPADYRDATVLRALEASIQAKPGVKYAEISERTGSVTVYHEEDPEMMNKLGEAISSVNAHLFDLLAEEKAAQSTTNPFVKMFRRGTADGGDEKVSQSKLVPALFVAAGIWQMIETESLLAGMAPLVLFYMAFDYHWKTNFEGR